MHAMASLPKTGLRLSPSPRLSYTGAHGGRAPSRAWALPLRQTRPSCSSPCSSAGASNLCPASAAAQGPAFARPLPGVNSQRGGPWVSRALPTPPCLPDLRKEIPAAVRSDLPAWLSLAGYAALHLTGLRWHPTPDLLFSALAWYQLAWSALSLLSQRFEFDRVGTVVAPAFLAIRSLPQLAGRVSPWDTAVGLFGYYLARDLPGPVYLWLPTLAYAIYSGYASTWVVAAFWLGSLWRLVDHFRAGRGGVPPVQHVAFTALAGWGAYSGQAPLLALLIMGGQLLSSAVSDLG